MAKIKVAILGATGAVGQRFVAMLAQHPWFEIHELVASERSAGRRYREVVHWLGGEQIPQPAGDLLVQKAGQPLTSRYLFSGLDAAVAGEIEAEYARRGHIVISNAKNHRMEAHVPLVVPEVNADHLDGVLAQLRGAQAPGAIITNPNCVVAILALALAPLHRLGQLEAVMVTSMQAISGAGYPGVSAWDITGNVLPYIAQEEPKVESELIKILGHRNQADGDFYPAEIKVSASCYRVPVLHGHSLSVSVKLKQAVTSEQIIDAWRFGHGIAKLPQLPSSPVADWVANAANDVDAISVACVPAIRYCAQSDRPQPALDAACGGGMTVSVGRLRPCSVLDWKFSVLGHNTVRGAAGGALLNAEYLVWRLLNRESKSDVKVKND